MSSTIAENRKARRKETEERRKAFRDAVEELYKSGKTINQIAFDLNVSEESVRTVVRERQLGCGRYAWN